jgi:hypothetical protein
MLEGVQVVSFLLRNERYIGVRLTCGAEFAHGKCLDEEEGLPFFSSSWLWNTGKGWRRSGVVGVLVFQD